MTRDELTDRVIELFSADVAALAAQPREDGPPSATVSRPGSVQRVNAVDEEMDEEAGALSTW